MKAKTVLTIIFISLAFYGISQKLPIVTMETNFGKIVCEIDTIHAPVTAHNFLNHIQKETYKNAVFYRVVRPDNQPSNKTNRHKTFWMEQFQWRGMNRERHPQSFLFVLANNPNWISEVKEILMDKVLQLLGK